VNVSRNLNLLHVAGAGGAGAADRRQPLHCPGFTQEQYLTVAAAAAAAAAAVAAADRRQPL
jgi:hypothetical protein